MNETRLPEVRENIKVEKYDEDGKEYIVLYDDQCYAQQPLSFHLDFIPFLQLLNSNFTFESLESKFNEQFGTDAEQIMNSFKNFVQILDNAGYLNTPRFQWIKNDIDNYINSDIRPAMCAGSSYSDDKAELSKELDEILNSFDSSEVKTGAEMIIVPHIDFRIGEAAHKTYAAGYHTLKDSEPDVIVIFGTSHTGSSKRFILTEKHFETPLGLVQTDGEIIKKMRNLLTDSDEVIIDDLCHRYEHSIEIQVVLAQHYFKNKTFKILPILVNSFISDLQMGSLPNEDEGFNRFLEVLKGIILGTGKKAIFIASVDLAHVGKKFGDDYDAKLMLNDLKNEDQRLIHYLAMSDPDSFFNTISQAKDKYKICGLAPIYSMLKYQTPKECRFLHYDQWYEEETESAVSFASLAYYN